MMSDFTEAWNEFDALKKMADEIERLRAVAIVIESDDRSKGWCPECQSDPIRRRVIVVPGIVKIWWHTCDVCEWSTVDDWDRLDIEYEDVPLAE